MAEEILDESDESKGGIVTCSSEFNKEIGDFAELFSTSKAPIREAARFAMAVGIQKNRREKRSDWKKSGKRRTIAHLHGQFDANGRYNFKLLFEMLGLSDEDTETHHLISEYVTGGMRWITENELKTGYNFSNMKDEFPYLFSDDESN